MHTNPMPANTTTSRVDNRSQAEIAADEASWDAIFAAEERASEMRAFEAKMERNELLENRYPAHSGTRVASIGTRLDTTAQATTSAPAPTRTRTARDPRLKPGESKFNCRYKSWCTECRADIAEGTEVAGHKEGKKWKVRHFPSCPERVTTIVNPEALRKPNVRMITPGQAKLIADLQVERGVPVNPMEDGVTFAEASELISKLIKMPRISKKVRIIELHGLREGRYAVPTEDGADNKLAFYNVTERGVFIQLSDSLHAIPEAVEQAVIAKILIDPAEAARTYGRELGECGVCGRTLTNDESRAYGIGPVCRNKTGW